MPARPWEGLRRSMPNTAACELHLVGERMDVWRGVKVYTIGHSTRPIEELVQALRDFGVSTLVDIRSVPRSRHNPQFNADALAVTLRSRALGYAHLPRLGGHRRARRDSPNTGWRNVSFRGFADYMSTDDFEAGLLELRGMMAHGGIALMCAEAVPWRCHRSLIADVLTARGARVCHLTGKSHSALHRMTPFARVKGASVTYPGDPDDAAESRLTTRGPFHLEATVRVLQRRPTNIVDVWDKDRYSRVLRVANRLVLVEVENRGTITAPDVRCVFRPGDVSARSRAECARALRKILGLDLAPEPLLRLTTTDHRLRPTARALRGMRPPRFADWFETFASVVPFQQLSLDAGVAIVARFVERFGEVVERSGRQRRAFPTAQRVADARLDALRGCGLSSRKAESLRYLARAVESNELSEASLSTMSTADAFRTLIELPGIGPWSASLILLRGLGRLDVFPAGDVGAARALRTLFRLTPRASIERLVESFGAHRGYLYFCGLGGALIAKGLIHPASSR
jgi:3-methyladenine DNA glycosylase/8-oxoguanine DNA glycosylase